jgi:hypothetical protein
MGFTPSIDPTSPGAVLDCINMTPTLRGMKSAPAPTPFGNPPFSETVLGAATCELLNGTYRTFAAVSDKIYEIVGNENDDVSGMSYTGGANRWGFAQFGNATLAVNGSDPLQQSISAGPFADIPDSPVASQIEVVQGFVFLFDTIDPVYGNNPNGWWCSALYNQEDWVPAQATQCARGVIIDTPGRITAGKALGTNIVVFKKQSMYYATYQGPPVIWAFNQISPIVGTPNMGSVVSVGTNLFFLGSDFQVYSFDGTRPVPIGDEVHEWLRDNWSAIYQANTRSLYDQTNSLVYWYFCSKSNNDGIPDLCLVLNHRTGKFGRADLRVESTVQAISGQITWDQMGSLPGVTTWDTLPKIPYNSSYWAQSQAVPAVFTTDHQMQTLSGVTGQSSVTSGWFGDDSDYTYIQGILPRFKQAPETCNGKIALLKTLGTAPNVVNLPDIYDGEIACDVSARWSSITLNFTGNHEILGAIPRIESAGAI